MLSKLGRIGCRAASLNKWSSVRLINTANQQQKQSKSGSNFVSIGLAALGVASIGSLAYFFGWYQPTNKVEGPLLRLDLNEIYEKGAVMFLRNKDLRDTLGVPIKVTSTESEQVRTLNLRREGDKLFSLIAYTVEGSINSGVVFCKLVMTDQKTQEFKVESMFVKLNKPDKNKRIEFLINLPPEIKQQQSSVEAK